MSSWTPSILIAHAAGESRAVSPLVAADARWVEVFSTVPVHVGDEMDLQIRCSAGARRVMLDVRVRVEARTAAERGHRIRFAYLRPDEAGLAVMATVAREMGLMAESPSAAPPADEALNGRLGEVRETFLVDATLEIGRQQLADQLLAGSLMVETALQIDTNTPVLVRVVMPPDGRPLWLAARVVYLGEVSPGCAGVGLALDVAHEVIRRELRQLRDGRPVS